MGFIEKLQKALYVHQLELPLLVLGDPAGGGRRAFNQIYLLVRDANGSLVSVVVSVRGASKDSHGNSYESQQRGVESLHC